MKLNCKISSDLSNLDRYNKIYGWIPSSTQIRPNDEIIEEKQKFLEEIQIFYKTEEDYLLDIIFNQPTDINNDGKIISIPNNKKEHKLLINKFPYQVENSNHYIMWYKSRCNELNEENITEDINSSLKELLNDKKYQFVWYENPKMNITSMYHVQVFCIIN